jgi:pimeloyl-ACP methyl ester carboxylesterase
MMNRDGNWLAFARHRSVHLSWQVMTISADNSRQDDLDNLGEHGFVDSSGVKIHYVTYGAGPLVVLIHGQPDHWYLWRYQIPALSRYFQVVAIDLRGYNLSDQPEGMENYTFDKLVGDVDAVVKHFKQEKVTLVGHDWGGFIAWQYAMAHPDKTDRLTLLNMPHPRCFERELANNPQQYEASEYARQFQENPKGGRTITYKGISYELTPELFASGQKNENVKKEYLEALRRSSIDGMMNYYKANFPRPPYQEHTYPPVKCRVLMIHGLDDPFLMAGALNDTWRYLENDFTLVTVPKAGHWVQTDAPDLVTKHMVSWLTQE